MARPSEYKSEHCKRIVELGQSGASVAEMAYELGCVKNTLNNWAEQHEEFLTAFTRAKLASQVWWERKGREGMEKSSQEFQSSVWSRSMAARFPEDWRETVRNEQTGKDGGPIETEGKTKLDVGGLDEDQLRAISSIRVKPQ